LCDITQRRKPELAWPEVLVVAQRFLPQFCWESASADGRQLLCTSSSPSPSSPSLTFTIALTAITIKVFLICSSGSGSRSHSSSWFPSWLWRTGRHIAFIPPSAHRGKQSHSLWAVHALDDACSKAHGDLTRAVDRLRNIGSQEALLLLRASFSVPRLLHYCYDVPIKGRPGSCSIWQSAIYCVTNCNFSSVQWLQASLPVRDGGLGIRSYHRMPVFAGIPDGLVGAIWHISSSSPFWTNFLGPAYCCSGLC